MERFYQLSDVAFDDPALSDGASIRTLMLVVRLALRDGYCYASNDYLADKLRLAPESVSRTIAKLKNAGYITLETGKADGRSIRHIVPNVKATCAKDQDGMMLMSIEDNQNVNRGQPKRQGIVDQNVKASLTKTSSIVKEEELEKLELNNSSFEAAEDFPAKRTASDLGAVKPTDIFPAIGIPPDPTASAAAHANANGFDPLTLKYRMDATYVALWNEFEVKSNRESTAAEFGRQIENMGAMGDEILMGAKRWKTIRHLPDNAMVKNTGLFKWLEGQFWKRFPDPAKPKPKIFAHQQPLPDHWDWDFWDRLGSWLKQRDYEDHLKRLGFVEVPGPRISYRLLEQQPTTIHT